MEKGWGYAKPFIVDTLNWCVSGHFTMATNDYVFSLFIESSELQFG